ncbi:beta-lactamase-like protein [Fusarium redolens]|jgi:glyoxylase-like metal-dependent hydrolase (beta-lactamase superfamily II)|uniref:Beta-lactamase-like protein n=1 Tax=Fusarium redolens TaxID=48865 RepID=A0A9P9G1X6_FUSRE|nr:beta-lactamase-like protein [Fusarium redolens]KAH7231715.1 beta-lactamase-like protein [Fusarium redolens]
MRHTNLLLRFLNLSLLGTVISLATGTPPYSLGTSYDPIPTGAIGPPVPNPPGYRLQDLGDGAYMVTDGIYQAMFLVSCESVIVVYNPPSIGYNMLNAIRNVTSLPISHVVYSHSHADHIGAAYVLGTPENVTFVAHRQTADQLAMTPDKHRPPPSITFQDSYKLQVCNQTLELNYMGSNHEPGNIFIWAPLQKIIMLVDIVYPGWVPYYELGVAQNVPGYVMAHKQILTYDFKHYIGGHLDRTGTREDVLTSQAYVNDLFDACVEAMNLSKNPNSTLYAPAVQGAVAGAFPGNSWLVVDTVNTMLSGWANNVTNEKWKGKLAGLDIYGESNAATMLEAVLINWGISGAFGVSNGPGPEEE